MGKILHFAQDDSHTFAQDDNTLFKLKLVTDFAVP